MCDPVSTTSRTSVHEMRSHKAPARVPARQTEGLRHGLAAENATLQGRQSHLDRRLENDSRFAQDVTFHRVPEYRFRAYDTRAEPWTRNCTGMVMLALPAMAEVVMYGVPPRLPVAFTSVTPAGNPVNVICTGDP